MSQPLPARPNLEWLKRLAKDRLAALRARDPEARLSDAQLAVAREHGFPSWRQLKAHVEQVREQLAEPEPRAVPDASASAAIPPDDAELADLLAAVRDGDAVRAAQLLNHRPALARAHGPGGQTALHLAARYDDPTLAVLLVSAGADLEAKYGESGHTALSWAVTCNALACARTLVLLGARPDLFCAAGIGAVEHVSALFDETGTLLPGAARTGSSRLAPDGTRLPCPPQLAVEQVSDALYMACRNAQLEVARFLLDRGADLSFRAFLGGTALHWAYFGGSPEVVALLEQAGADRSARDDTFGCTPRAFGLCVPAAWGFNWMVRARLAADPSLALLADGRTSPLHEAARGGHADVVRLLLDAGADRALRDGHGKTALEIAAEAGHANVSALLGGA